MRERDEERGRERVRKEDRERERGGGREADRYTYRHEKARNKDKTLLTAMNTKKYIN